MTPDNEGFARLIREWQTGSPDALGELLTRHADAVRAAVRRRLPDRLRAEYDSLDFVQDVWTSLAALAPDRYEFPDQDALVGFLTRVAEYKVIETVRQRFGTRKRDVNREERLPENPDNCAMAPPDRQPSPSQLVIGDERWGQLLGQLPEGHKIVAERLREGYTHAEIANQTGLSLRTVERVVRRLKELCEP